jgi:hypothetical protein
METVLHGREHVDHSAPRKKVQSKGDKDPSTVDLEAILHGGEHVDHSAPSKVVKHEGNQAPSTVDMEAILHGGEHVDHSAPRKETPPQNGQTPSTADMDLVLHGGEHVHHGHGAKKVDKKASPPPMVEDIESLLHGSQDGQHIHTREKKKIQKKGIASGTLDPHALIHGEHKIATGAIDADEEKDYEDWKKQDKPDDDAYSVLGFSFPFISDSILNEIDMLKRRYIPKFWSDLDEEVGEDIQPLEEGRFDDVTSDVTGQSTGGASDEVHTGDDMRHELENIGNTDKKVSQHLARETTNSDANKRPRRKPRSKHEI